MKRVQFSVVQSVRINSVGHVRDRFSTHLCSSVLSVTRLEFLNRPLNTRYVDEKTRFRFKKKRYVLETL